MRLLSFVFAITLCSAALAQGTPSQNPTGQQVIENAIRALSIAPGALSVKSFALTGTLQVPGADDTQGIRILSRGLYDVRVELSQSDGTTRTVVESGSGRNLLRAGNGVVTKIRRNTRAGIDIPFLPLPALIRTLVSSPHQLTNAGLDSVSGRPAYHIVVSEQLPKAIDPDGQISRRSLLDIFVDADTSFILKISHTATDNTGRWSLARTLIFADYREVGPITVPFSIVETIDGQTLDSISIASLDLNHSFVDEDFQL